MLDKRAFFIAVLRGLNCPVTDRNISFFLTWAKHENRPAGKGYGFNPLNTTFDNSKLDPKQTNYNYNQGFPVKNYSSFASGVYATVQTLKKPAYGPVINYLKTGNPAGLTDSLKKWGTVSFANNFKPQIQNAGPSGYFLTFVAGALILYLIFRNAGKN